jgi:hypothetical protein
LSVFTLCAFTAQVAGFEHGANVAAAASAHLGIAKCILDHPLVNCACFIDIGRRAGRGFDRGFFHDAVGRHVAAGLEEEIQFRFRCAL